MFFYTIYLKLFVKPLLLKIHKKDNKQEKLLKVILPLMKF